MAVCEWCKREMTQQVSCTVEFYLFGKRILRTLRVAGEP